MYDMRSAVSLSFEEIKFIQNGTDPDHIYPITKTKNIWHFLK